MYTIYGRPNSSNVRKVLWLCEEIGLTDYERLDYGRGYEPVDTPAYAALNPNKIVPTLIDGDLVLWESNAIMRYLAAKHGPEEFYPADLIARAKVDMWMDWQLTTLITGVRLLFQGLHMKDTAYTAPEQLEQAGKLATSSMEILDANLTNTGGYVAGETFTIADCALAMFVHRWYALPIERQEFIALEAYYERLKNREPFQKWIIGQGV